MLAGNFTAPHRIDLVEAPEPQLTAGGSGEIIFEPELTCLCGSDTPYFTWSGEWPIRLGHSLHEMIGRVVATNGQRWKVGDRVLGIVGLWSPASKPVSLLLNKACKIILRDSGSSSLPSRKFRYRWVSCSRSSASLIK